VTEGPSDVDSNWLDHHGKRKNYLWLAILVVAACVGAFIFVRNNSEVLGVSHDQKREPLAAALPVTQPLTAPPEIQPPAPVQPQPKPAKSAPVEPATVPQQATAAPPATATPSPPAAGTNESVPLEGITCSLIDKSQPSIRLSMLLSFPVNAALKQEILLKRDNLKVMVKKTLALKSLDDMVVDSLRRDLKSGLNSVLENGAITDIEFKEFRIEKVE
jgi:flagellar basal body-associated protein FliL